MTKIDWYIVKKFLGTFIFMLILIMALAVIFDFAEKINLFSSSNAPIEEIIFDYYLNFIIYYSNLFSPLFIFITVILFTANMAQKTEIVAILSGGVSFNRFLRPYMISAGVLITYALIANHFLIPHAKKGWFGFEERYLQSKYTPTRKMFHREFEKGKYIYFRQYNPKNSWAKDFILESWGEDGLIQETWSESAFYDSSKNKWSLYNYVTRGYLPGGKEYMESGMNADTVISFTPNDVGQRWENSGTLITPELVSFINLEKEKGNDSITHFEIELHKRTALPFATLVLVIIGVSVSSRKVRGGIGLHLASGLGLCMVFIFSQQVSDVSATNAGLSPLIAVWVPNILFGFIAYWMYQKAPK